MNIRNFNDWLLSIEKQSLIMGILNVTPDSFSDGGKYLEKNNAINHALAMIDNGADIIDVGGESTRPFSDPVSLDEEISRVIPVIEGIRKESDVCISIDTTKSEVATAALNSGASLINDVSAMEVDPFMIDVALKFDCPIIIMHMKGTPKSMQDNPQYESLISDIKDYLQERVDFIVSKGVNSKKIVIDPGIGFGKTLDHNYTIMRKIENFKHLDLPILVGISRKSLITKYLNIDKNDSLNATTALNMYLLDKKINILRVHDVKEAKQCIMLHEKIKSS